ncbi:MAG: phosphonate metabolism protein/1,5-bisphosphokinase (PRPP-forming) PhnN [Pseudomonadota bacterium]
MSPDDPLIGPGALIAVVGPSGAGKDTLIEYCRRMFAGDARVVFPTRVISRAPHHSEAHVPATVDAFESGAARDGYALSWAAHDLLYALPRAIDDDIRAGRVVVANLSRAALPAARCRYARIVVVHVDAPIPLRAARLAGRGREAEHEIASRMARTVETFDPASADAAIVNDGTIEDAGDRLAALIQTAL